MPRCTPDVFICKQCTRHRILTQDGIYCPPNAFYYLFLIPEILLIRPQNLNLYQKYICVCVYTHIYVYVCVFKLTS